MMRDYRDRTNEFFATVTAIQKQRELTVVKPVPSTKTTPLLSDHAPRSDRTQFTRAAAEISRNICVISQNLEKLALLAKQKSLFKDPSQEINALTFNVKRDLDAIEKDIETLEKWSHDHVATNRQAQENSETIVQSLKTDLATQTRSFADILLVRTKNMKDLNTHRREFESPTDTQLLRKRAVNYPARLMIENPISEDGHEVEGKTSNSHQQQEQQQLLQEEIQDEYLLSRAAAVEQIEKTIVELGQLYQRLISLVAMQEEMVIRIDENVDNTLEEVRGGHKELIKYFGTISSGQWLLVKIFLILIVFGVFFITVM